MDGKKKESASQANERDATRAHLYRLAQARALLRALEKVSPPGASSQSIDEIPENITRRVLAKVAHTPDGKIKPSKEDFEAVRRESSEI